MISDLFINFDLLWKLAIYVFLPLIAVILISRLIIVIVTRKIKKDDIDRYYSIMNYWTSFVAIIITIILLVVTVIYVIYFLDTMKSKGLIENNKIIYYLVFLFPIIPFSFLIYYIMEFIYIGKEKNNKVEEKEEFQFDLSRINKLEPDLSNSEIAGENISQDKPTDNSQEEIEIL